MLKRAMWLHPTFPKLKKKRKKEKEKKNADSEFTTLWPSIWN